MTIARKPDGVCTVTHKQFRLTQITARPKCPYLIYSATMPISDEEKQDVITSVTIELESMFTILSGQFDPEQKDKVQLLEKIEDALKSTLRKFD